MIEYVDQLSLPNGCIVRVSVRIPPLSNKATRDLASQIADESVHKAADALKHLETP